MAKNKANLMKAFDVLVAIREAAKDNSNFEAAELKDDGALILKMFDGSIWVLSQKGVKNAND